jgi:prepilin-type N-terminal cleavage/methylation domain-containing protein
MKDMSNRTKSINGTNLRGFTIVELLIVIVVIGILAALVLNAFSGVQAKARDVQRDSNMKAVATQLEAFFNGNGQGGYPNTYANNTTAGTGASNVNLSMDSDAPAKLPGIDVKALRAPNAASNSILFALSTAGPTAGATASTTATTNVAGPDKFLYEPYRQAVLPSARPRRRHVQDSRSTTSARELRPLWSRKPA